MVVKPVAVFGSKTWVMAEMGMKRPNTWERKILRRVYGTVVEQGTRKMRTNQDLCELYRD